MPRLPTPTSTRQWPPFEPWPRWRPDRQRWYIRYPEPETNRPIDASTPYRRPEDEEKVKKTIPYFLARLGIETKAAVLAGAPAVTGPFTVRAWSVKWMTGRKVKGIESLSEYRGLLDNHVLPVIADRLMADVTIDDIEQVMAEVAGKELAPKTQRNVYACMHAMFAKAVPRVLKFNPCAIQRGDLPKKVDKDPEWRALAIFTREEARQLISDDRIPLDRRVFYAVLFLAGTRFGEASALLVRHYTRQLEPLGMLLVAHSYSSKQKRVKGVKILGKTRKVPVHAALAVILGWWVDEGFEAFIGRRPLPDDPLVPARWWKNRGQRPPLERMPLSFRHRPGHTMWKRFLADLARLGLRRRRQHDARRTFITLCRSDGADKDLLRLVTHGPDTDIMSVYSEMPWETLCAQVAKLKFEPGFEVARVTRMSTYRSNDSAVLRGHTPELCGRPLQPLGTAGEKSWAQQGSKTTTPLCSDASTSEESGNLAQSLASGDGENRQEAAADGIAAATATLTTHALRQVADALARGQVDAARALLAHHLGEAPAVVGGPPGSPRRKAAGR